MALLGSEPVVTRKDPHVPEQMLPSGQRDRMRRMNQIAFLLLSILLTLNLYGQDAPNLDANDELIAIEKKRSQAIAAHDTAFLARLYADDFRGVTATGYEVNKERLMSVFQRDDPSIKFELSQLQSRIFDDMAIVTGRLTGKTVAAGDVVHDSLYIHVFQKRDGIWQIVAGQGTMISKPR